MLHRGFESKLHVHVYMIPLRSLYDNLINSTVSYICYESKLTILVGLPDCCNLLVVTSAQDFNEALFISSCFTDTIAQSFGKVESLYGREGETSHEGGGPGEEEEEGRQRTMGRKEEVEKVDRGRTEEGNEGGGG